MAKIPGTPRINQYSALEGQILFLFDFVIYSPFEIVVQKNETKLEYNTDYSVDILQSGGSISLFVGANLGDTITIYGDTFIERDAIFSDGGPFEADPINNEYNKIDNLLSEIVTELSSIIKLKIHDASFDASISPQARRAIVVNEDNNGFVMSDFDPDQSVEEAEQFAEQAAISANISGQSADAAQLSATNADNHAQEAHSYAQLAQYWAETVDLSSLSVNIIPSTDLTYDIGSAASKFNNIHANDLFIYNDLFVYNDSMIDHDLFVGNILTVVKDTYFTDGDVNIQNGDVNIQNSHIITVDGSINANGGIVCSNSLILDGTEIKPYQTALVVYEVATGLPGGNATQGIIDIRPINIIKYDNIGISIVDNKITIPPGEYLFSVDTYHYNTGMTKCGIWDFTNSNLLCCLGHQFIDNVASAPIAGRGYFNIGTTIEVQIIQICSLTRLTYGMGYPANFPGSVETYLNAEIKKLS